MRRALFVGILALLPTFCVAQMVPYRVVSMPTPMAYVEEYDPPAIYREWYENMQRCSGVQGPDFKTIRFYAVDSNTFLMQGWRVIGWTDRDTHSIWLARWGLMYERLVSHELLHVILGPGHPTIPWAFPCGVG